MYFCIYANFDISPHPQPVLLPSCLPITFSLAPQVSILHLKDEFVLQNFQCWSCFIGGASTLIYCILHFSLHAPASASNFKDWLTDDKNISNIAPNPDLIKPDKKTCQKEISDTWIGTFRCDRIYQQLPHTPIPVSVWISQSAVIHSFRLPHLYQQFPIPYLSVGLHRCDPVILSNTHSSTQGNGGNYSLTHPLRAMVATYLTLRGIATCLQLPLAQVFWAQQLFLLATRVALHSTHWSANHSVGWWIVVSD